MEHFKVAIIGAGFGGLGMAIRLRQEGEESFVVLERAAGVGGVWRDNTYPGCACDVQSHLYSFSFAPNPHWTRRYSPQAEIEAYLRGCVERFGLGPFLRLEEEVVEARWESGAQQWRVRTSRRELTADVVVAASGALSAPSIPEIPGLGSFEGEAFHSARWNHSAQLTGKRVAVVGTGASAIQFVPRLQPKVAALHLFQRTPPWVLPRFDGAIGRRQRWLFERSRLFAALVRLSLSCSRELLAVPFLRPRIAALIRRVALFFLRRTVADPALRAKLTPSYEIGCKRILLSDDYYPALQQRNVEVIASGLREVRARSVVAADGQEREVDVLIFGTGFEVADLPIARRVHGREGIALHDVWGGSPRAHLGTTVAGFPNFFLLLGPNTGVGHTSVVLMMESQIEHVISALRHMRARRLGAVEPLAQVQAAFVADVDEKMRRTVWVSGGCRSWYLDRNGRNFTLWPGFTNSFRRKVRVFREADYCCEPRRAGGPQAAAALEGSAA